VYPLHSLDVLWEGLFGTLSGSHNVFPVEALGAILTPQTNSFEHSVECVRWAAGKLGVSGEVPVERLKHWSQSRPTKWFIRNPLLIQRFDSLSGGYYENQILMVNKLRFSITAVLMMSVLQGHLSALPGEEFGSSRTNNWETLDIKHFFVFYPEPGSDVLSGDCVPMNVNQSLLIELSELSVQIDPSFWRERGEFQKNVIKCISGLEGMYYRYVFGQKVESNIQRVISKFMKSLEFFQRSFRRTSDAGEGVVYLAFAFEIMLTDSYSGGVRDRVVRRAGALLGDVGECSKYKDAIDELYRARGGFVHSGLIEDNKMLECARLAYVYVFLSISQRLDKVPEDGSAPIAGITVL
ncbi:MAG: hypothetical protein NWF07_15590, partial [Candidatus Bathyarchaeota archaeon]|nr:hypothetical protein [Candidatus Bathyarchaeota archaeon]